MSPRYFKDDDDEFNPEDEMDILFPNADEDERDEEVRDWILNDD